MSIIVRSLPAYKFQVGKKSPSLFLYNATLQNNVFYNEFSLQMKVLMNQIYHLSHSDRNIALKFMDMYLKHIKLSLFNVSHFRHNSDKSKTHLKYKMLKKALTIKSTKYPRATKINTLRRKRNGMTLKSLTDSLNLDENQSNTIPETNENCNDDIQSIVSYTKEDHEENQYFPIPIYYEENENVVLNTSDKHDFIIANDATLPIEDFPAKIKQDLRKFNCHICNTLLDNFSLLLEHLFNHNVAPRSCNQCKNSFPNAIPYKIHLNTDCSQYASASSNVVFNHFVAITESLENKLKAILICPHCGVRYK